MHRRHTYAHMTHTQTCSHYSTRVCEESEKTSSTISKRTSILNDRFDYVIVGHGFLFSNDERNEFNCPHASNNAVESITRAFATLFFGFKMCPGMYNLTPSP